MTYQINSTKGASELEIDNGFDWFLPHENCWVNEGKGVTELKDVELRYLSGDSIVGEAENTVCDKLAVAEAIELPSSTPPHCFLGVFNEEETVDCDPGIM